MSIMSENYIITEGGELYHWGVKGMKWGVRKANRYRARSAAIRTKADEFDDAANTAEKHRLNLQARHYRRNALKNRRKADDLDRKASIEESMTRGDRVKRGAKTVAIASAISIGAISAGTVALGAVMVTEFMDIF